ncbi:hypothetical protein M433DRAFT_347905 [Acidomyces richmondensis BFW]|nr:MAG: hypothetical protein FE78DRAFT_531199 [Acidomyces sp. 'richmondensis']KYG50558.1 hypothetical protein M433DRAFT_347905 [Acidomyces richmondensis BFW]
MVLFTLHSHVDIIPNLSISATRFLHFIFQYSCDLKFDYLSLIDQQKKAWVPYHKTPSTRSPKAYPPLLQTSHMHRSRPRPTYGMLPALKELRVLWHLSQWEVDGGLHRLL